MKLTFLGVSSALSDGYNSNILIENDKDVMLFDCGEDIKHSLKAANRKPEELGAVFISHLHSDHSYGLSWLGYYSYFIMKKRIPLYIHESMVSDLWSMLRPAMEKIDGHEMMKLDDYFNIVTFDDTSPCSIRSFFFTPVKQVHVETPHGNMYSYGITLEETSPEGGHWESYPSDNIKAFISSDTKKLRIPHETGFPKTIFSDVDVMNLNGVHPNYDTLKVLENYKKKNMWLYHYHDLGDEMPDAVADGFAGFVKEGQIFELESIGQKVKEALRDDHNSNKFKPDILEEEDKYLKWGGDHSDAFGSPGFKETEVKKDETIYANNNRDKPFSLEGLDIKRKDVEENRKDKT